MHHLLADAFVGLLRVELELLLERKQPNSTRFENYERAIEHSLGAKAKGPTN